MVFSKQGRNHHKTPRLATLNLRTLSLTTQQIFNFCALMDEKVKIQNKEEILEAICAFIYLFLLDK